MKLLKPIELNKLLGVKEGVSGQGNKTLNDIKEYVLGANNIAIFTHESPDGDAIGSVLAVYLALKQIGKEAKIYVPIYSKIFDFLPGVENLKDNIEFDQIDLAIALDCSDTRRLEGKELFETATDTIVIDHHGTNNMYGDINYVDSAAPACAQVLISIFQYLGIELTKEIGTCLVTGIMTDTGGFQYQGVTPETFEFAAELLRKEVNISDIAIRVLQTRTKPNFELTKKVVERMELIEDGKIAFSYITQKDQDEAKAEAGDHEGLVEIGRSIEGVQVSIFLRQDEEKNGYKISMRSKDDVNVADICYFFGGGGHIAAAGCFIKGTLETVKTKIIAETKKVIKKG